MEKRARTIKKGAARRGPVVYWMSREQRVADNPALLFARSLAEVDRVPLVVAFCLVPRFLGATMRQYAFMLTGLAGVEDRLRKLDIPMHVLAGPPAATLPAFLEDIGASVTVTDFDPLRVKMDWKAAVCGATELPVYEVDGHNIVPCWAASNRLEYAAYTIRPKIRRRLREFLRPLPPARRHRYPSAELAGANDWAGLERCLDANGTAGTVDWIKPGEAEAGKALKRFTGKGLKGYAAGSNDPASPTRSDLSPYLHFGQIYSLKVALEVERSDAPAEDKDAFLEELIIRKELSDNFCLHQPLYDSFEGFPGWARKTLDEHRGDARDYVYPVNVFEAAATHDGLWNAAQTEMLRRGKMHGYLRMYWAKKILEWSASPEEALATAIYLNDRYELDGRDPNGYAGVAWSIGGVHDRAWAERKVFGKIRYMSLAGCRRKFDVARYIDYASKL